MAATTRSWVDYALERIPDAATDALTNDERDLVLDLKERWRAGNKRVATGELARLYEIEVKVAKLLKERASVAHSERAP